MAHSLGRLGALMFVLVTVVGPSSDAQARQWGLWSFFGNWGQTHHEGRRLRPSIEADGRHDSTLRERRDATRASARPLDEAVEELLRACSEGARELQHWPNETLAQLIAPDESQRGVLEHLRSDAEKQAQVLSAACPHDIPSDPVAQLDVSKSTAEAVLAAVSTITPLVEEFYTKLSDEQKARLIAFGVRTNDVNNARPVRRSARRLFRQDALDKLGLCQWWERAFRDLPKQPLGRELRSSDEQHSFLSVVTDFDQSSSRRTRQVLSPRGNAHTGRTSTDLAQTAGSYWPGDPDRSAGTWTFLCDIQ